MENEKRGRNDNSKLDKDKQVKQYLGFFQKQNQNRAIVQAHFCLKQLSRESII